MTTAPTMCESPCETCAKEGLPLLLTRYALMPDEARAPRLGGGLDAPELGTVPLDRGVHYGLRLLRSGYVYVFDELRSRWDEYFVTSDGFLAKMPMRIRALKARQQPATEFQCARNGAAPLAGVITIRNPRHAAKVWIAFSDVAWTDRVFDEHQSAEHRRKHMKCLVLSGGKVEAQPGTAPLEQADQHVPEFALEATSARRSFGQWCPHAYNSRHGRAEALVQTARQMRPDGGAAIVALHDPVGLAMEIAALVELRKLTFLHHESVAKPRLAASAIASLESTLKEQAKLAEIAAGEALAQREESGSTWNPNLALSGGLAIDPEMARHWRTHTPASLQRVADAKWRAYTHDRMGQPRFDAAASRAWLGSYGESLQQFDAEHIAPLARAHVAWLKHRCMVSHLSCNYDSADLDSGAAYTAAIAAMLRHTSDKQPSHDQYLQWTREGDTSAADNLLMRALGFNQDRLLAEINKADQAPLDGRAYPSDMLLNYAKDGLEKLPEGGMAAMADLLQSVGGALFRNMDALAKGGPGARAIAALAAVAGVQFTPVEVTGKRGKFVQHLMQSIMQIDPNLSVKHNQMGKAVEAQLRLLEIEGLPMAHSDKRRWLTVLDRSAVRGAAGRGLSGDALAAEMARSLHQSGELPRLKAAAFRAGVTGTAFGAVGNATIGLVQAYNFTKLVSDYTQGMAHERTEAAARLAMGAMAIVGSFGEAAGLGLQKVQEVRLRNAPGRFNSAVPKALTQGGRYLGLGAGLLVAGMDLMKWRIETARGDAGLARAHLVSATLGGSLAIAFFLSHLFGPIGWLIVGVALLALFMVTAWIEQNKDNRLQEWLMRCHFGTHTEKYETHGEQVEQLKRAFA